MPVITEGLAGKRVAVTGATGFLGTALVERLLRSVPDCEVAVLVRPGRRQTAAERVRREIIRNDCFDRLRAEWGDRFDAEIARRLLVMAGDVSVDGLGLDDEGRSLLASCDVVVHSAAAVAFDSPLDADVEINLLGPSRVATTLAEVQQGRAGGPSHLVAVSTAYVAGTRRGGAPEPPPPDPPSATDVAWKGEVPPARRPGADADAASRDIKEMARFH